MNNKAIVEGLLFVVGEDGLTIDQIKDILDLNDDEAKEIITTLMNEYESIERGIRITFLGNTFKLTTKKEHCDYYQKLIESPYTNTLSQAALETLAIVAYNEPITRLTVTDIRGVDSSQMMRKLSAKGLIKEVGRSDAPGKPILYKTTNEFLDYFGLSSIADLPQIQKDDEENDEIDLFKSKYQDTINEV